MPADANFTQPDGLPFERVPEHLWGTDMALEFTEDQMDRLRATLMSNKDASCYYTTDLKGLLGVYGWCADHGLLGVYGWCADHGLLGV